MGCVYCVTNNISGKKYIGKTVFSLEFRKKEHIYKTKCGSKYVFHNALRKHGIDNFDWEIIFASSNNEILCKVEIDEIKSCGTKSSNGYNLTDGGEGTVGYVHSEVTRSKISKKAKNRKREPHSEETKKKMSISAKGKNLGRKFTEEEKIKRSKSQNRMSYEERYGKEKADELKKKMRERTMGFRHSEESKNKMSISQKNRIRKPHSEEHKRKIGEAHKGKIVSEETREKLRNRIYSQEARKNMSIAQKKRKRDPMSEETKIKLSLTHKAKTLPKIKEAVYLHTKGLSGLEIAKEMDVNPVTVWRYLKRRKEVCVESQIGNQPDISAVI